METGATENDVRLEIKNYQHYMFEYVAEGAGFVECGRDKYYCPENSVYFFQPGGDYLYYHDAERPWRKIYVIFEGAFADAMAQSYDLKDKIFFPEQQKCLPYFRELLHLKYNSHEKASVLVHHIFNQLTQDQESEERVSSVIHILKTEIELSVNRKFILKDFAAKRGVSTTSLIGKFKEHYQCTPYEYMLQCKLNSAGNMLKYTKLSIKEIASMLDFNDQYYFSNLFKQRNGVSPKKFREMR